MTRLDNYRSAMLAVFLDDADPELGSLMDKQDETFAPFVVDHGLGPLWHQRTGRDEFHKSRMAAESYYLAQERALVEIDASLNDANINYAVIKGVANRLLLNDNPAIRACHDIDLLVAPEDRLRTTLALQKMGYRANPDATIINHELELSRDAICIDLHWGLLRRGRLRNVDIGGILASRRRESGISMLAADDAFFLLLVHPAFAKHLAGWDMGLHRVADIVIWIQSKSVDWGRTYQQLESQGVLAAAWATLRWVQLVSEPHRISALDEFMLQIQPGKLRRKYLSRWLLSDMSARTKNAHWLRQLGFSLVLHDTVADTIRALRGRLSAHRHKSADLSDFEQLVGRE